MIYITHSFVFLLGFIVGFYFYDRKLRPAQEQIEKGIAEVRAENEQHQKWLLEIKQELADLRIADNPPREEKVK